MNCTRWCGYNLKKKLYRKRNLSSIPETSRFFTDALISLIANKNLIWNSNFDRKLSERSDEYIEIATPTAV